MKKRFRLFSLFSIFILYSFILSLYCSNAFVHKFSSSQTSSERKHYSSVMSSNLLCHTAQTDGSTIVHSNARTCSLKSPLNEFTACSRAREQQFLHRFSQYNFFSQNLVVRLQHTDMIFPSHYFL